MENKHTPGPWGIERDGTTLVMGDQIVATAIAQDGAGVEVQRANVRLIAAAPDLLEALEAVLPILRVHALDGGRLAESAIAKAKGVA